MALFTPRRMRRAWGLLIGGWALIVLGGCTNIPPIAKIGLIAPFEGLYRQSGYDALAAMRGALASCAPPGMALVPLALDGGADPDQSRRAAAKLALDPAVAAVIGPLDLAGAAAAAEILAAEQFPWIVPNLVSPSGGYPFQPGPAALAPLAAALLQTQQPTLTRLLIAGLPAFWRPDDLGAPIAGVPLLLVDTPEAVLREAQTGDAVLWMGLPEDGARLQNTLAALAPAVPLWLGPESGGPIFAAHLAKPQEVYWLIWRDRGYNTKSSSEPAAGVAADLAYQATCAALAALNTGSPPQQPVWEVAVFRLNADGTFGPASRSVSRSASRSQ
ncbi:MAG: ABC transporter substrate-binding protein [Caldilineaceae bacterium]|nr:ABC transporter substrate-binding protein [Caldilineaceae bacterium]